MRKYTRGEFLSLGALIAGAFSIRKTGLAREALVPGLGATPPAPPTVRAGALEADLIVVNGRVLTMDDTLPRAQALAVKDGRFLAVGSTSDIRNVATARTTVVDANGMTVTPGFIDAHCHPSGVNELYGVNTNVRSVREVQEALRKKAAQTPPGEWVSGFMFDDTKLTDAPLTRRHLDEAVPNLHAGSLRASDGHPEHGDAH